MPNESSLRGAEKNVQDWISLVCGALLFVSPWALGFAGDLTAARTAWVGGIVIGAMAIAALVQFAEWEEWVSSAWRSRCRHGCLASPPCTTRWRSASCSD
jgi:SPW repeat